MPCLLQLYAEEALAGFEENLFAKLLLAVRPELAGNNVVLDVGKTMSDEERQSIFAFVQTVLEIQLQKDAERDRAWVMTETMSFLAAFDKPIGPFLNALQRSENSTIRANVCVFMANHVWQPSEFGNVWLKGYAMLPENSEALNQLLAPASVAAYLLEHIEDVQRFDIETREAVGYAFEWATDQSSNEN